MFFVMLGFKDIIKDNITPDGTTEKLKIQVPHLALMQKQDYWNNNPAYIELK